MVLSSGLSNDRSLALQALLEEENQELREVREMLGGVGDVVCS